MNEFDHYQILGVSRQATAQEIRSAYVEMVKRTHPDANPTGSSTEIFQKVLQAYQVLSDPAKRDLYDLFLSQKSGNYSKQPDQPEFNYQNSHYSEQSEESSSTYSSSAQLKKLKISNKFFVALFAVVALISGTIFIVNSDDSTTSTAPFDRESDIVIDYAVVDRFNPSGISYSNLVEDALRKWASLNPRIKFRGVVGDTSSLDLLFTFEDIPAAEDYVGLYCSHGCDSYTDYAEIVIDVGENVCNPNPWHSPSRVYSPYVYKSLLDTTMHEIGHHLGLDHHASEYHLLYSHGDNEARGSNYDTLGFIIPQQQIRPNEQNVLALAQLDSRIERLDAQLSIYDSDNPIPSHLRYLVDEHDNLVRYWNARCRF